MKKIRNILINCSGHSLIELLVSVAVVGIIAAPMSVFFITNYKTYFTETAKLEAQQQLRAGMDRIMTDLRRADHVAIENINGENRIKLKIGTDNYSYYKEDRGKEGIIIYQHIASRKNQLVYNVKDFLIEGSMTEDNKLQSVTVTMEIWVNKSKGEFISLKNMHKIRY